MKNQDRDDAFNAHNPSQRRALENDETLLGDFVTLKKLLAKRLPKTREIRNAASILRRWLIESELTQAGRRYDLPRFRFSVPDTAPVQALADAGKVDFFCLLGADAYDGLTATTRLVPGTPPNDDSFDANALVELGIGKFLDQIVAYSGKRCIKRHEVIQFVCNKKGATHFDSRVSHEEHALERLNAGLRLEIKNGQLGLGIGEDAADARLGAYRFEPSVINGCWLETLACAHYVMTCPQVRDLEKYIKRRLKSYAKD
jgi:hypothetical protein